MDTLPPGTFKTPHEAFKAGVGIMHGQSATARLLGFSQPKVHRRLKSGLPIWAESVEAFEDATKISRHDLRPDLYPRENAVLPSLPPIGTIDEVAP